MAEETEQEKRPHLHIFVNRRRFGVGDGVRPQMTGAEIAALVKVPADIAVVRWANGPKKGEKIAMDESVHITNGDHFLVTRKRVEGGA